MNSLRRPRSISQQFRLDSPRTTPSSYPTIPSPPPPAPRRVAQPAPSIVIARHGVYFVATGTRPGDVARWHQSVVLEDLHFDVGASEAFKAEVRDTIRTLADLGGAL